MKSNTDRLRFSAPARAAMIVAIAALHLSCYVLVGVINAQRPATAFKNIKMSLDRDIPYWAWTGVFYYYGDLFVILFGGLVVWTMPRHQFRRAIFAYAGMILAGAISQLIVPARAPWPVSPNAVQKAFHTFLRLKPYACLPSMHVALSALPAFLSLSTRRLTGLKFLFVASAVLITISTVTYKEHYVLDAVAGAALALASFCYWRLGSKNQVAGQKQGEAASADF
jgi:hypothetical protein